MRAPLRIVLADRQTLFLDALQSALTSEGHAVLAAASTRRALVDAVRWTHPSACLIDSQFPDGDAISIIVELLAAEPAMKIVVLSADDAGDVVGRAFDAGVHGYVHKSRGLSAVLDALVKVSSGARFVAEPLAPRPRPRGPALDSHVPRLAGYLTPRELQCLRMLTAGLDTTEMAAQLGVSITTVRSHVQSILTKLGAHSRLEAASLAIRHGLVPGTSAESA
jgi:DNA-binding NarL/FixJ family response regulator